MKKRIAAIAMLISLSAFLSVYFNFSLASAEGQMPSYAAAFDFNGMTEVTYGAADTNIFYDTLGTDTTGITAELLNDNGNKAVKLNMASDYSSAIILRNTCGGRNQTNAWPDKTSSPKGIIIKVGTGQQPVAFRMGFQLAIKGGVFTKPDGSPLAEGTPFRFFPGIDSPDTIKLFDSDGRRVSDAVNNKNNYNATVTVPANFSGYLIYEFNTLYMEGGASYTPVNGINRYDQRVSVNDVLWFDSNFLFTYYFDTGVKGGTYLTLDDYGYLTDSPADEPLKSDVITGGDIPASGELDTAWKFRKNNADPVSGRIITYLGGYKNIDGAAYLIKRTADSEYSYFMYQEIPISKFAGETAYTLRAYMRGYQINKNISTLPENYGTYLYAEFVDDSGIVIDTAADYSSKMPFGVSDWNLYSLSFIPDMQNTALIRVGVMTNSIICETAIDDISLTFENSVIPDYTGTETNTIDTAVSIDSQLNPNSSAERDFNAPFRLQASIGDNATPSPSQSAAPSQSTAPAASTMPTQSASTAPPLGSDYMLPVILSFIFAGISGAAVWFISRKLKGSDSV